MNRILLLFLTRPTFLGSILSLLMTIAPAKAAEIVDPAAPTTANGLSCVRANHSNQLVCVRIKPIESANPEATIASQQPSNDDPTVLDFTDEESDAAVAMFGCDCPPCIRSLRQLRGLPT